MGFSHIKQTLMHLILFQMLRAELHYLNGEHESARVAYEQSITSARETENINNEALACELFGIFLCENKMINEGIKQLQMALEKYRQWGAARKVRDLEEFIESINISHNVWRVRR